MVKQSTKYLITILVQILFMILFIFTTVNWWLPLLLWIPFIIVNIGQYMEAREDDKYYYRKACPRCENTDVYYIREKSSDDSYDGFCYCNKCGYIIKIEDSLLSEKELKAATVAKWNKRK